MKLTFFGAAHAVTGSCHCLEACGKKILIDCGLQQGRDEVDDNALPFHAGEIDYVIVTHAHIDHSGRLPLLKKQGFTGKAYTTRLTAELLEIMLLDSAHIQEQDVVWTNQKGKRAGRPPVEPLYTVEDAMAALDALRVYDYQQQFELCPGVQVRFQDAGHLLGSAIVEIWATEGEKTTKLVFSGDLGNRNQPIIRDPSYVQEADYVITESTYGDRNHLAESGYTEELAKVLNDTFAKGGNVIIPAFAVGRTQELLYFIREIKERNLVPDHPDFPVYVDSPLAKRATTIFAGDLTGYIDEEAKELVADGIKMFTFPGLNLCETAAESQALNAEQTPKVIISASGMCDAGRIRHHLKHNLWRPECTVCFVGFQSYGSLGRTLLDGAETVKLFGERIAVKAKIVNFHGLSSHADQEDLLAWAGTFFPRPKKIFVVHGDADVVPQYVEKLRGMGLDAHAPKYTEVYDLDNNCVLAEGYTPERKVKVQENPYYSELLAKAERILEVAKQNKGGANRDLRHFAADLEALINKYQRGDL